MRPEIKRAAEDFVKNETQYHLGFLPTEQSNPKTKNMEKLYLKNTEDGVHCLQSADYDVLEMAKHIFSSPRYRRFMEQGMKTIRGKGRIVFSGCGSTGRLSILLESMWRKCCSENECLTPYADCVESIMTGGDFAMIKAVEFFEDYAAFGKRQVQDANLGSNDMLVAITEGGETSSVLGTLYEAADRGCSVFLLFNNPADILCEHLERSRIAIQDPRVTVLDLYCGPMALAGSTRMQATTQEQLVAGAMLESVAHQIAGKRVPDYIGGFETLLSSLGETQTVRTIADYTEFEVNTYRAGGKITYFTNEYLLDIFTDTTERSPTFMLPPFRAFDDTVSPQPWAFVKNPLYSTPDTWKNSIYRELRCLSWDKDDYIRMNVGEKISEHPPRISAQEVLKIHIGNESCKERFGGKEDSAVCFMFGSETNEYSSKLTESVKNFSIVHTFGINTDNCDFPFRISCPDGMLHLLKHLGIKLILNTVSTGTMVLMGRVSGNWMSWVNCTNKKLIDRGIRLLTELTGIDYQTACEMIFEARDDVKNMTHSEAPSPVQLALSRIKCTEKK